MLAGRHRASTGRAPIQASSDLRHIGNSLLLVSAIVITENGSLVVYFEGIV
jgi:hypothetical protein